MFIELSLICILLANAILLFGFLSLIKANNVKKNEIEGLKANNLIYKWKDISSAPKDKEILLGVDSYDCGWVVDTGWWLQELNNGKGGWCNDPEKPHHMKYTHWMFAPGVYDDNHPPLKNTY